MNISSKSTRKSLKAIEKIAGMKLTLGKLIWAIREGEGVSQINFAEKLNISRQHLCDLEHNRKTVSPKLAATYAEQLGYSKAQFIRLCLQDMIDREGLNVYVEVTIKKNRRNKNQDLAFA
jgi:transcriptional regulator with XRE-family HTH domain